MNTTKWYPAEVKPVRKGLYQRDFALVSGHGITIRFSYWNGRFWGGWAEHPIAAMKNRRQASSTQSIPWRGLASKP